MKIHEAVPLAKQSVCIPFKTLFENLPEDLNKLKVGKGIVGQLIVKHIGLTLDNYLTDFEDGELKTNKHNILGKPLETIFITQISNIIDTLIGDKPLLFEKSNLFRKISKLIILPVVKEDTNPGNWYFQNCFYIDLSSNTSLLKTISKDYYTICETLNYQLKHSSDELIHTASGRYIQIRSKDSKPYFPIWSVKYGRYISNKNHAFYFKKDFMNDIHNGNISSS